MQRPCVGFVFLGQTHSEYPAISKALLEHGIDSRLIDLNHCQSMQWQDYSLINVRECRGYHHDPDFLSKIETLETQLGGVPMTNSFNVIRAGIDKANYLRALEQENVELIPTLWFNRADSIGLADVVEKTGWHDFVLKPTVSSKSWNTYRVVLDKQGFKIAKAAAQLSFTALKPDYSFAELTQSQAVCIQQFMPEIFSRGELSFVFIDNTFSHAIRKTVAADNWLAHEFFGGENVYYPAASSEISWAENIFNTLRQQYGDFLYARIDAIPDGEKLCLLECELMVPRLFLSEGQALGRYVQAIKKRLR